jgi:hypothetical protein
MAQQPNIELTPGDRPRPEPSPGPNRRWSPGLRPGVVSSPDEMPRGGPFGTPGPDTGYALKIIGRTQIDGLTDERQAVLAALMGARAAAFGRAPTPEDLEVAMALCGTWDEQAPAQIRERAERWFGAVPHEKSKGRAAVADIDHDLLMEKPDRVRTALRQT